MFTLNNWTEQDVQVLSGIVDFRVNGRQIIRYIIFQKEVGTSGTPHLQGYCELATRKTLNALKWMNHTFFKMHIERRRGTQADAIKYCRKTGPGGRVAGTEVYEFGERRRQGGPGHEGRNRWSCCAEKIQAGAQLKELRDEFGDLILRNRSGVVNAIEDQREHRNRRPKVKIY